MKTEDKIAALKTMCETALRTLAMCQTEGDFEDALSALLADAATLDQREGETVSDAMQRRMFQPFAEIFSRTKFDAPRDEKEG